jgi:hypothetical protein
MTTTGDGAASPMKRKAKSRYLNVKLPPKVFGMGSERVGITEEAKTAFKRRRLGE